LSLGGFKRLRNNAAFVNPRHVAKVSVHRAKDLSLATQLRPEFLLHTKEKFLNRGSILLWVHQMHPNPASRKEMRGFTNNPVGYAHTDRFEALLRDGQKSASAKKKRIQIAKQSGMQLSVHPGCSERNKERKVEPIFHLIESQISFNSDFDTRQ
jgi:hypothetical protein